MENIKKRILLTAVSGTDPYTNTEEGLHYGSLLSILKLLKNKGKPINEIYMYFSLEMAIPEARDQIFSKAINYMYKDDENIIIKIFPEGIIEKIKPYCNDIEIVIKSIKNEKEIDKTNFKYLKEEDITNIKLEIKKLIDEKEEYAKKKNMTLNTEITANDINTLIFRCLRKLKEKREKEIIGRINVNEYGSFYIDINHMIDKVKEENNFDECEMYLNISSGTSAMQSDFNLMGITNSEINAKIIQVSTYRNSSNNYPTRVFSREDELELLKIADSKRRTEKDYKERAEERSMITTKRLILLKNLESSFKKRDFAGVANAIKQDSNIVTEEIESYANNLYYRYIGAEENARKTEKRILNGINLYPLSQLQNEEFRKKFENIIEKFNVMKTKVERNEFNDWLLISTPIIEKIIEMILEVNGVNKNDFIGNINKKEKISLEAFEKSAFRENEKLREIISKNNGEFPSAYRYMEIMEAILNTDNKDEIMENVRRVDTTRGYRIRAAHSADFVVKDEFEKNVYKDFYEEFEDRIKPNVFEEIFRIHPEWDENSNKYDGKNHRNEINIQKNKLMHNQDFLNKFKRLEVNKSISRVDEVHKDIERLLKYIYDKKSQNSQAFEDACNMYKLIENEIIKLLKEKINEYK